MTLTITMTYACEVSGCTTTQAVANAAEAETSGWTYSGSGYGVASMPPPAALRCPTHKGQ